jgi:hypothetical protein
LKDERTSFRAWGLSCKGLWRLLSRSLSAVHFHGRLLIFLCITHPWTCFFEIFFVFWRFFNLSCSKNGFFRASHNIDLDLVYCYDYERPGQVSV